MSPGDTSRVQIWKLFFFASTVCAAFFAGRPGDWDFFIGSAWASSALLLAIWRNGGITARELLVVAVLLRMAFFPLPPVLSDDAYRYVWDGVIQWMGVNPYHYLPEDARLSALHDSILIAEMNSADYFSVYAPLSQAVFFIGGLFYERHWLASYFAIKAIFVIAELAGILLLLRMADPRSVLLYAWNPIVLIEIAGQAHTEGLMIFFLAATVWCFRKGYASLSVAALIGAGFVKLYPFFFLPFLLRRVGWMAVWPALLLSVPVILVYLDTTALLNIRLSLDLYVRFFEFNAGPYYTIKSLLYHLTQMDLGAIVGRALQYLFLMSIPVLYYWDHVYRWSLEKSLFVVMAVFFSLSTTVHPWYPLGIILLAPLLGRLPWGWLWLTAASTGTYSLYVGGPYFLFVALAWTGWALIGAYFHRYNILEWVQRRRAEQKVRLLGEFLENGNESLKILDLGAGEGYVADEIQRRYSHEVEAADIIDLNRSSVPYHVLDSRRLPFPDQSFDLCLLIFVLHHAAHPGELLSEALRVSRDRILVVESVYAGQLNRRILESLDRLANRIRSGGKMNEQEQHLMFRTIEGWRAFFAESGLQVIGMKLRGRFIHRQAVFELRRQS